MMVASMAFISFRVCCAVPAARALLNCCASSCAILASLAHGGQGIHDELIALIAATVAATPSIVPAIAVPGTAYSSTDGATDEGASPVAHPPSQLLAPPIGRTG